MTKKYLLIIFLCLYNNASAQQNSFIIPDSLSAKDYEYFSKNILYTEKDSIKEWLYAHSWLAKAKREKNFGQMAWAYKVLIYKNDKKLRIIYADSMVTAAKRTADIELIGAVYMTRGAVYYDRKEQMKALDNYLIADEYISKTSNKYQIYKIKYGIAQIKYYLGFYDEAIALFKECLGYFKEENSSAYLNSLHSLGLSYNRIGKYKLCSQMNQTGIGAGLRFNNLEMQSYFIHSEGVNQYFKHNYPDAIKKLTKALPSMKVNKDFTNETTAYFYIGKSYWALKLQEKAVPYLKKIDEAFQKQKYIRPDLREAYEILIDYYQQQNDKELELYYVTALSKVDQVLIKDYKYLSGKIHKEYDTKNLIQTQRNIEHYWTIIITIMTVIIAVLVYRHYKNKRLFEELMNRKPETTRSLVSNNTSKETELDINPEVIAAILKNLEKFERNKKYLEKDMTLAKMALLLNTNTKYVSKIIARYRDKGTVEYITYLKIEHIIKLLINENKYRNYKNKSLSDEAGFGSTQIFTRAFKNQTGLSPTYFISKLRSQQHS
ncbi:helix-turn-helix domain-containing protein [Flavobacterium sp. GSP27]|uniref:AraC family transcriptional regulator n=1 Tax=unclassified Flavobacterium TaxID=196869 RepID=UPI000F83410D|nr:MULTISPECIES: AraC family transcriptional regulator [unclassified Flavobacterium]RTY84822.1 helix-turn-helix domain-containing protein [Flavobacterium sp. ZB4P23]RTZ10578.1 helix-turn-helix domain-containing protein [Flavobacterium sp. GSP27]